MMEDIQSQFNYAAWRLDMWLKGYGSYREIEEAVHDGELIPGKKYPDKRKGREP